MADSDRPTLVPFGYLTEKIGYIPTDAEADRARALLVDASELIRDVAGLTWLNEAEDDVVGVPHRVQVICREAAYRAFDNPTGLSQRSIGDSSRSYDRSGREGGEAVYLTTDEERAVRKAATGSSLVVVTLESPYTGPASWLDGALS